MGPPFTIRVAEVRVDSCTTSAGSLRDEESFFLAYSSKPEERLDVWPEYDLIDQACEGEEIA
jgi:hypothetical protein